MNLIIDIGNSFVKMAVFQGDELVEKEVVEKKDFKKKLEIFFSSHPGIEKTILSSVSDGSFPWAESLKDTAEVVVLGSGTPIPFQNDYATPASLGNDRKALVAAASRNFKEKNTLIIDAGTCLTFDFKDRENRYLGGSISPGLKMRFNALHNFTANLPYLEPEPCVDLVGNTTAACMNNGVVMGMVKEIDGIIEEYKARFEGLEIILTGGDAHFLSMRLKNVIFANSNFLLEGLNYILEFNKTQ